MGQQQLLLIILGVIIVGIAVAVGLVMFQSGAANSNRDALISDMNNLGSRAQAFYRKPVSMGGGGGAFNTSRGAALAFDATLTTKEKNNQNGTYVITSNAGSVTIVGTGVELVDGSPVKAGITVFMDSIRFDQAVFH